MELLHTTSCFNAEALNKHFIQQCALIESGGVWACQQVVRCKHQGPHTHAMPSPPTLEPSSTPSPPTPPNSLHFLHTLKIPQRFFSHHKVIGVCCVQETGTPHTHTHTHLRCPLEPEGSHHPDVSPGDGEDRGGAPRSGGHHTKAL